jgi:hypothetical protein
MTVEEEEEQYERELEELASYCYAAMLRKSPSEPIIVEDTGSSEGGYGGNWINQGGDIEGGGSKGF